MTYDRLWRAQLPGDVMENAVAKLNYSHEAMIDLILMNPEVSQKELAGRFGYTEGWISRILRSDAFREAFAARKLEIVDPMVLASVEEKFEDLVHKSLTILSEKLNSNPTPDLALKTAELGARALGYGAKSGPSASVAVQFVVHTPEKAKNAAEWLANRSTLAPST